ncbi:glycosyltransferase [Methylobacterium iners]|uniref:glycosyltransferase n=1 Tax=Methylobacterium iners TaxID=418707 RepID=UPI001EE317DC|nr:glycosyltransferase [Methylobacterium iners]
MKFFPFKRRSRISPSIQACTERVRTSSLFDEEWYLRKYPDVRTSDAGPLAHFCEHGMYEHRDPGPNFDTRRYLNALPEAGLDPMPPFLRALDEGEQGEEPPHWLSNDDESLIYLLRTSGLLDEAWYYEAYPDVARSGKDALIHYLEYGAVELRNPGPGFDAEHYALTYPEYRVNFPSPIVHFLRIGLRRGYLPTGSSRYERWLAVYDDFTEKDRKIIIASPKLPAVRCLFLVDEQSVTKLKEFLKAITDQIGADWCACLLRAPCLDTSSWATVVALATAEPRVFCVDTIGSALDSLKDGEVILLGTGVCRLRPHACHTFAFALSHSGAEAAYSDHDRIDHVGVRHAPVFKPSMSPVFMRQVPYAGLLVALRNGSRTRKAISIALTQPGNSDRKWADLLLQFNHSQVVRIPLILYHQIVEEAVLPSRMNQPVPGADRTWLPFTMALVSLPTVDIIIPTRDRSGLLRDCIDSILAVTDYSADRYRIIIVDNDSVEDETFEYFDRIVSSSRVCVVVSSGTFNFSKICNDGAAKSASEILIFLNNDITIRQEDWLRKLVCLAKLPDVGAVGAQLLYPDDTVQHGGVVLGIDNIGGHVLVDLPAATARNVDTTREIGAVTGACLAIRRALFEELGGFDPLLRIDFNDVDLCCRASEAGYRNLYVAEPLLYHHESLSRGRTVSRAARSRSIREGNLVRRRHASVIRDDPFYNPNLSLTKVGHLAVPPRVVPRWRRRACGTHRVLLLSSLLGVGSHVGRMVAEQQVSLLSRDFEVIIGGLDQARDLEVHDCRHVVLADVGEAATFAIKEGVDAIVAHTAPFFAVTRLLGRRPLVYLIDHGDPSPDLFPDRDEREDAILEKRVCASLARRVFCTSVAAQDALFGQETVLLRDGPVPNAVWSNVWEERRSTLREKFGFSDRFVVLSYCHTGEAESRYNGFNDLVALAAEYAFTDPALAGRALFVAVDRGPIGYPANRLPTDLVAHGGVSNADLVELLAASDLYVTTQRWQGADCGIALALAMGLPVIASDITTHRVYPIETTPDVPGLCRLIAPHAERWRSGIVGRQSVILPGPDPLAVLADTIAADIDQDSVEHWI